MKKNIWFTLFLLISIGACQQQKGDVYKNSSLQPVKDTIQPAAMQEENREADINYKIIQSENGVQGFGYDIYIKGKIYVHQPTIPAVAGNKGFSTKQKAEQSARLVIYKIKNNILPPTVEIRELDSLHLLE